MTEPGKVRYAFIDALRGIAAVWVVVYHAYSKNLLPMTGYQFPAPLHGIFDTGNMGVYIFFVISGFVIMQSIRSAHVTAGFIGRFALRRSLRLDPPYWATIAGMIVLSYVSGRLQRDHAPLPQPTWDAVVAHLFYVQGFLGYPQIVSVFWTLCYEIQFYLVLAIAIGVLQWQRGALRSPWLVFVPLWLFSALCIRGDIDATEALAAYGWPYFFLGVVVNWVHNREAGPAALALTAAATALLVPFAGARPIVALVTAGAVYAVSASGRLASLTLGSVLQYLGRISYSLYLVHMLVGTPLVRFGLRRFGKMDFAHASLLMLGAIAVSVAAAHVLYVAVERPAVRWSHRVFAGRARPVNVAAPVYD